MFCWRGKLVTRVAIGAIFFIGLTILWLILSYGLHSFENGKSYFEIKTVAQIKILFAAIVFMANYLLFPVHHKKKVFGWSLSSIFLILSGAAILKVLNCQINYVHLFFIAMDALCWSVIGAFLIETIIAVFRSWFTLPEVNPALLSDIWQKAWQEIGKMGFLLTLNILLGYYYLVSFYLVDILWYSYLLVILLIGAGAGLFILIRSRIRSFIQRQINAVDVEINEYLDWNNILKGTEIYHPLLCYQYLILTRNYLKQRQVPVISIRVITYYLLFSIAILILPYVLGLVIEV